MQGGSSSSSALDRNAREKNRRMHMKHLLDSLASVLPNQSSKLPVNELLDQTTLHIKMLKERMEDLKGRREVLKAGNTSSSSSTSLPEIAVRSFDSIMEVNLIIRSERSFTLHEFIRILQQEGAEVVNLSYQNIGGKVYYTVYCQALSSRIGMETSRIQERLKNMFC